MCSLCCVAENSVMHATLIWSMKSWRMTAACALLGMQMLHTNSTTVE
jgi:hypothetical protein